MGILKATMSAIGGAAADQWKEAFCAGEMGSELLMTTAKRMTGEGSSGVITDGSVIIVGEGECAIATEGGKVIGVYGQPGEHIFKSNQSSGIFGGGLGSLMKDVGRRISFGGDITISQRLYYINTKELTGGSIRAVGLPLRYKDPETGLDMDGGVSCYGSYTFRICDPELFYKVARRSPDGRSRSELLQQMDSEVLTALAPALAQLTAEGIRPNELMQDTKELCEKLRRHMSREWSGLRGIEVFSLALDSISLLDADMLRELQQEVAFKDPVRAAAHLSGALANTMQTAAANGSAAPALFAATVETPAARDGIWRCSCGSENKGKFCTECGAKRPAEIPRASCRNCGWIAAEQSRPPKFCPECGKPFAAGDR
ncbi:MAG: SPFH domain-containing protein [Bacillota bacterium]|nr:SPFH domain-containing protein [Bacillota bacterium]